MSTYDQDFYKWWSHYREVEPHPELKTVAKAAWFAAIKSLEDRRTMDIRPTLTDPPRDGGLPIQEGDK